MEVAKQLPLQHRLQLVEQQQVQQRRTQRQTQQRRVAAPRPHHPAPDHPPYVEMVGVALRALAEPGGSSELSISEYIVSSFTGLPPAHDKLLPYYLGKLVSSSYLCVPSPGRYLLSEEPNPESLPHQRRRLPLVAAPTAACAGGDPPAPRRRGRPPKNRAAAAPSERPPSPLRRPRGRPRKNPLPPPPLPDVAVQKRKLVGRPRTKPSNSNLVGAAPTDMYCEDDSSNETEESGPPQSQPSEDASCVSNALDYEADEEPLLLDPMHCLPEEELLWGLPMQPEPEAKLWLPSDATAAGQPAMRMAELFGAKAAELRLPSDSAMAPATTTAEHYNQVQSPAAGETAMGTEAEQLMKDEQVVLHHGQAQVSITMQSTVEEDNKVELQEASS